MDSVTFLFDTVKFSFYKLPDFLQKKKHKQHAFSNNILSNYTVFKGPKS